MNMFVLVKVLLSIVLFFTKCNSSLFGRALDNDATYSSVNLFTNGENRSTIGNYSLLGITANSFSEVIHGSAVPQFVSPSSLSSASTFDRQLLQDMRDMPTSFKSPMSNASEFITAVRIGRCKAMCLLLLAPDLGRLRNNRGFLTDANCGNNEKCRICEAACEVPEDGCDQQCKSVGLSPTF